jgi:hypothetical protein
MAPSGMCFASLTLFLFAALIINFGILCEFDYQAHGNRCRFDVYVDKPGKLYADYEKLMIDTDGK